MATEPGTTVAAEGNQDESRLPEGGRYVGQFRPRFSRIHQDRDLFWVVPMEVDLIVAVTGLRFSGKSTVLEYLSERYGFRVYTLGNELRSVARKSGIALEPRRSLQDFGDEYRAEVRDPARLARQVLRRIRREHLAAEGDFRARVVVSGFRRPEELQALLDVQRVEVIALQSPQRVRYSRGRNNGVLEHELIQIESRLESPLSRNIRTFRDYIDRRDRTGREPNEAPPPYTQGYGQASDAVVEVARAYITRTRRGSVVINDSKEVANLFRDIDGAMEEIEQRLRLG